MIDPVLAQGAADIRHAVTAGQLWSILLAIGAAQVTVIGILWKMHLKRGQELREDLTRCETELVKCEERHEAANAELRDMSHRLGTLEGKEAGHREGMELLSAEMISQMTQLISTKKTD